MPDNPRSHRFYTDVTPTAWAKLAEQACPGLRVEVTEDEFGFTVTVTLPDA